MHVRKTVGCARKHLYTSNERLQTSSRSPVFAGVTIIGCSERIFISRLRMHKRLAALTVVVLQSCLCSAQTFDFDFVVSAAGEGVAEIVASTPGSSWALPGAEAAVATL